MLDATAIASIAGLVWGVTQVLKGFLPSTVDPRAIALLFSTLVAGLIVSGIVPVDKVELVGSVVLASLGSNALHDHFYGGAGSDTPTSPAS